MEMERLQKSLEVVDLFLIINLLIYILELLVNCFFLIFDHPMITHILIFSTMEEI